MALTAPYATFDFYEDVFLGAVVPEEEFARFVTRASEHIDRVTHKRAEQESDSANILAIRKATCAVAELLYGASTGNVASGVLSERLGNHSVTYAANASSRLTLQQQITDAAAVYLGDTGLMYAGFASEGKNLDQLIG